MRPVEADTRTPTELPSYILLDCDTVLERCAGFRLSIAHSNTLYVENPIAVGGGTSREPSHAYDSVDDAGMRPESTRRSHPGCPETDKWRSREPASSPRSSVNSHRYPSLRHRSCRDLTHGIHWQSREGLVATAFDAVA